MASSPPRRLLVIVNPTAGRARSRRLATVLDALKSEGAEMAVLETRARGDAERLAAIAAPMRHDAVVVAGGDGTINEAINGLAVSDLPLAIIPLGTANVLASELGLPKAPAALARLIATAAPRAVHVGEANGRRFALMVGAGFDARVVEGVNLALKRRVGKLAYVAESLAQIARHVPCSYEVEIDGVRWTAASAVVAKGRYYGGTFTVAPRASLNVPRLHVCLFARAGRWNVLRYAAALVLGRLHRLPDVRVVEGQEVRIVGPAGEAAHGDGDVIATLPLDVRVSPRPLRVIA